MSDFDIKDAINAAKDNDVLSFKDVIHSAIEDKVSAELELKKMEFAGNIFNEPEETPEVDLEIETEIESDEEAPEEISNEEELEIPEEQ